MPNDKVSHLSLGIAAIMIAHGIAAWAGLVKGSPTMNFVAAGLVALFAIFGRR